MNKYILTVFGLMAFIFGCSSDELKNPLDVDLRRAIEANSPTGQLDHFILPNSTDYENLPADPNNPLSEIKVELGRMLFYETGLALQPLHEEAKGTYSCASCHIPEAGFMPGREQGMADGGQGFGASGEGRTKMFFYENDEPDVQGARALSLFNAAFTTNTAWSGQFGATHINEGTEDSWVGTSEINHLGFQGAESQAIETFDLHRLVANEDVIDSLGYKLYYDACFGQYPESERYSRLTTGLALAAYLRSVTTTEAPFQQWLKGNEYAMTDDEKEGAMLFFGKAGCFKCHNGKALNNPTQFFAVGVKDLYETGAAINTGIDDKRNLGRGGFTNRPADMYKFKVPQLYNMKDSPFFFHGSSKHSLREVVEYFNEGVAENALVPSAQIAPQFQPLGLSEDEIEKLTLFLEHSLYDQDFERFIPAEVLSGNCFPNNDAQSREDLGCD